MTSSTTGYRTLTGSLQVRQRPRRATQLATGTFSYQVSWVWQPGQRERGRTTDSSRGTR